MRSGVQSPTASMFAADIANSWISGEINEGTGRIFASVYPSFVSVRKYGQVSTVGESGHFEGAWVCLGQHGAE